MRELYVIKDYAAHPKKAYYKDEVIGEFIWSSLQDCRKYVDRHEAYLQMKHIRIKLHRRIGIYVVRVLELYEETK